MRRLLFLLLLTLPALAQQPFNFVLPTAPGRIAIPATLVPTNLVVDDYGTRPVITFQDKTTHITYSYILYPNHSETPTATGCRTDFLNGIRRQLGASLTKLDTPAPTGPTARASWFIPTFSGAPVAQQNEAIFYGNAKTCAQIHVSKVSYTPADKALLQAPLATQVDLAYVPTQQDYFLLATLLFNGSLTGHPDPAAAVPYYAALLAATPVTSLKPHRIITDQLAMALGISGQLKQSRALLESAVAADPDYPINYYNLACADAEEGNARAATQHLQQAFARKHNVLPGEHLPDPTKDDSLLKLKDNTAFWTAAQNIAHSLHAEP